MLYRQEASPSKSQPKLFHLITIWMGPAFASFFLHQFPAHLRSLSGQCILGGGQTIAYRSRLWGLFPVPFCAHSQFTQHGASFSAWVHLIPGQSL